MRKLAGIFAAQDTNFSLSYIFRKNRYNALKKIMDDKKVEQEKAMELPHPAVECGEEARAGHINGGYSRRGSRGRDKYDSSKYEPRFHREVSHAVMQSCSHAVMQSCSSRWPSWLSVGLH